MHAKLTGALEGVVERTWGLVQFYISGLRNNYYKDPLPGSLKHHEENAGQHRKSFRKVRGQALSQGASTCGDAVGLFCSKSSGFGVSGVL